MSDRKAIHEVECPCCHGVGHLVIRDMVIGDLKKEYCCHCEGVGTVKSEIGVSMKSYSGWSGFINRWLG